MDAWKAWPSGLPKRAMTIRPGAIGGIGWAAATMEAEEWSWRVMSEITECPRCGAHNVISRNVGVGEGWWTCRACQAHGPDNVERCMWAGPAHPAEPGYLMCTTHLTEHHVRYGPGARAKDGDQLVEHLELDEPGRASLARVLASRPLALMVYAAFDHRTSYRGGQRVCAECNTILDGDEDDDVALIIHRLTVVGSRITSAPVPPAAPPAPSQNADVVPGGQAPAHAEELGRQRV